MHYNERPIQHDPQWKGPLKNRSCTDIPCLFVFIIFMFCWISIGFYAYNNGDIDTLLSPTDSEGRRCGIDSEVVNNTNLVFFDLTKCFNSRCNTPQVCVNKCPTKNWIVTQDIDDIDNLKKNLLCKIGVNLENKNINDIQQLINKNACAQWYLESFPVAGRCLPKSIPIDFSGTIITDEQLKKAREIIDYLYKGQEILNKIETTKDNVIELICASALLCLVFIVALKWIALPCVIASIIGVISILFYLSKLCFKPHEQEFIENNKWAEWGGWKVIGIILSFIGVMIILLTCCLWNRIYLACQLIKEASKAVISTLTTLFFPILPWVLQFSVIAYFITAGLYLISIGEKNFIIEVTDDKDNKCICPFGLNYHEGATCDPNVFNKNCRENDENCISMGCHLQNIESPKNIKYAYVIHIVGGLWSFFFISALGEMILAATFATWYWTMRKSDLPYFTLLISIWRTIRYHLGTVAFGSFLITVVRCFRLLLEYIHAQATGQSQGPMLGGFSEACYKCSQFLLAVLERFLRFMNRNAYIVCAIYGKGLCESASDALSLLMRNILRVIVLNKIVDWLLIAGKILVTSVMALITWSYYSHPDRYDDYWYVPVTLVSLGSYLVATIFFSVHETAVDTIFLCFLEDCERHDGSAAKPYYMTKKLAKLLRLHNNQQ
ncbi:hypothetical protein HCN44_001818 [Aphidius gifuensis]|uniref:Choline transporter-like protein n=1 Tax=Aphidius gifuensis TaxID=684658 RepID=A0A834Y1E3_APHGI|nr:choline transporter-like 2 isoform X2 [Aphidius gifuensis]KAF7996186.1 hypothetical protein HCN44_001818 [Aphidius gifuensis]